MNIRFFLIFSFLVIGFAGILSAEELTLLYWGDFQSQNKPVVTEKDGRTFESGGAALLSGMINQINSRIDRVISFDVGNHFPGSPISSITKGASQIEILNRIGVDIFVPGSHEFDFGWKSLLDVSRKAKFDILLANVISQETGESIFPPYRVISRGGIDIAVLGLIDYDFQQVVVRDRVLGTIPLDPVAIVSDFVSTFADSVDILVAATNLGWESDSILAAGIKGLDLIIGVGKKAEIIPAQKVNGTIITQAGPYGQALGYMTLNIDLKSKSLISYENKLIQLVEGVAVPNLRIAEYVSKLEDKFRKKYKRPIGRLETDWNISKYEPSNLAQWVADALHSSQPTNLSVINNSVIKSGVKRGILTEWDLWQVCPMEYSLMVFQVNGRALRYVIERQIYNADNPDFDFLTWSGLEVVVENGKLKSLSANKFPVTESDEFSVVTTGNIWDGFPLYLGLQQFPDKRPFWFLPDKTLRDVLIKSIEQWKIMSTPLDDRWIAE
ncbi:MAG: bifunctional metallophosphatase/5'-nucleotidase [Calditrichaeota bacterium]|nr:bifunctional metallophosphatase/5'-nucleotidase [Calditrichota bacterium]